jgi:hypothetical protein
MVACVRRSFNPEFYGGARPGSPGRALVRYGEVVDRVKTTVFAYLPVRSGSVAPIGCLNSTCSASLLTGPV